MPLIGQVNKFARLTVRKWWGELYLPGVVVAEEIVDIPRGTRRILSDQPTAQVRELSVFQGLEFRMEFTARQPMQSLDGCQITVVSNDPQPWIGNPPDGIRRRRGVRGEW